MPKYWISTIMMGHYRRIVGKFHGSETMVNIIFAGFTIFEVEQDQYDSVRIGDEY